MDRCRLRGRPAGVALVSALMVLVILFIIASAFVHLTARDVRSARTVGDSLLTLYLAEAGIEYAMWMNKHNMAVYPFKDYNVDDDEAGTLETRGSVAWLFKPRSGEITQEHVLINNLAYDETDNWLNTLGSCGTFEVHQTITQETTDIWVITITSIGRIRRVPAGWSWGSTQLKKDDLASADWQLRSKRTLIAEVRLEAAAGTLTTAPPAPPAEMEESKWYELFR